MRCIFIDQRKASLSGKGSKKHTIKNICHVYLQGRGVGLTGHNVLSMTVDFHFHLCTCSWCEVTNVHIKLLSWLWMLANIGTDVSCASNASNTSKPSITSNASNQSSKSNSRISCTALFIQGDFLYHNILRLMPFARSIYYSTLGLQETKLLILNRLGGIVTWNLECQVLIQFCWIIF